MTTAKIEETFHRSQLARSETEPMKTDEFEDRRSNTWLPVTKEQVSGRLL